MHLALRVRGAELVLALGVLLSVLVLGFGILADMGLALTTAGRHANALQRLALAALPLLPGMWALHTAAQACERTGTGPGARALAHEARLAMQTAGGITAFFAWPMVLAVVL